MEKRNISTSYFYTQLKTQEPSFGILKTQEEIAELTKGLESLGLKNREQEASLLENSIQKILLGIELQRVIKVTLSMYKMNLLFGETKAI